MLNLHISFCKSVTFRFVGFTKICFFNLSSKYFCVILLFFTYFFILKQGPCKMVTCCYRAVLFMGKSCWLLLVPLVSA